MNDIINVEVSNANEITGKEAVIQEKKASSFYTFNEKGFADQFHQNEGETRILRASEITGMARGVLRVINLAVARELDTVFFLDKSARPAAHLFLESWRKLHPGIKPPKVKYINIGTEDETVERATKEEEIKKLQEIYRDIKEDKIGIVDEFINSGNSLLTAKEVITGAFPQAKTVCTTAMFENEPSWYNKFGVSSVRDLRPEDLTQMSGDTHDQLQKIRSSAFITRPHSPSKTAIELGFSELGKLLKDIPFNLRRDLSWIADRLPQFTQTTSRDSMIHQIEPFIPPTVNEGIRQRLSS